MGKIQNLSMEAKAQMIFMVLGSLDDTVSDLSTEYIHKELKKIFGDDVPISETFISLFMSGLIQKFEIYLVMTATSISGKLLADGFLLELASPVVKNIFKNVLKFASKLKSKSKLFNKLVALGKDDSTEVVKLNNTLRVGLAVRGTGNIINGSLAATNLITAPAQFSRSKTGDVKISDGQKLKTSVDRLEQMRKFGG